MRDDPSDGPSKDPSDPRSLALPPPPVVHVRSRHFDLIGDGPEAFLRLRRHTLTLAHGNGTVSEARYDEATRAALDAAVILAHFSDGGARWVFLRSAVRPPLALDGRFGSGVLWELPCGLVDPPETPVEAAARELAEELGFRIDAARLRALGPRVFPAPAVVAEAQWFFEVEVDPRARSTPLGDGSPFEADAHICALPLREALRRLAEGALPDAKTEIGLRRLAELA
jgi:ADP-ribose pyrophosphatase